VYYRQIIFLGLAIKDYYSREIKVYAVGRNTYFKNTQKQFSGNFKGIWIRTWMRKQYGKQDLIGSTWRPFICTV